MKHLQIRPSKALCQVLAGLMLATVAATTQAQGSLAEAMERYEEGHWSAAYAELARLADQGDPEAARIALLMRRYGPALYKSAFSASPPQVDRWTHLASRQMAASLHASSTSRP